MAQNRNFLNEDVASSKLNARVIEGFFGSLKSSSSFIHFAFVLGATNVIDVGHRPNLLEDVTRSEEYSDMIGFTEGEIMETYKERLEEIVRERKLENVRMLFEKSFWPYYKSYRFSLSGISVFNPLSITSFLVENAKKPQPYWPKRVEDGTMLHHAVRNFSNGALNLLLGDKKTFDELEEKFDRDSRRFFFADETDELAKILFQTGYMTIEKAVRYDSSCVLEFVKSSLREKVDEGPLEKKEDMIKERDFEKFVEALEKAIGDITDNKYYKMKTLHELVVSFLLEKRGQTRADLRDAKMSQFKIGARAADYVKIVAYSEVNVIFYLKKYDRKQSTFNTTYELMKCHGVYVKAYADKHNTTGQVMCIVLILYTGVDEKRRAKDDRPRNTDREFIMDWAASE